MAAAGDANAVKQLARLEELAGETRIQTAVLQDIRAVQPAAKIADETQKILNQDRVLQVVQTLEARKADKDDDRIASASESLDEIAKKGLLDKTGDGLNANMIKLLKVMGDTTSGVPPTIPTAPESPTRPARSPRPMQPTDSGQTRAVADRLADQGGRGMLGGLGYVAEQFKKLGTLEGWFDTSDSKSQGLIGQAVMRKQAKNDFVKDQLATGATANESLAGKRFDKVNQLRNESSKLNTEVQAMRERGLSEEQIARTGVIEKQAGIDNKIAIANPLYRETRLANTPTMPASTTPTTPSAPQPESTPTLGDPVNMGGTSEQQAENLRMMVDQTDTLKQIEENTRGLAGLASVSKAPPPQDSGSGGGLLGSIAGMLGGGLLSRGGALLSRAGAGILSAGRAVASGVAGVATKAAPILTQAGGSVASGVAGVATKAAPVAAEAGGFLSKAGGVAKGILGKAALPLAAGMAVYDGVTGYKDAAENLGVEGREATTGEKASSAAGSIVSGLTFGLLDKKTASKGIASFFGAGPSQSSPTAMRPTNDSPANLATVAGAPAPRSADVVYNKSSENAAAAQQPPAQAPVVINAPTTNSVQQTQNYAPKSPPRNTESSYQQYNRSKYSY